MIKKLDDFISNFPSWKYIGHKREQMHQIIANVDLNTVSTSLELFGGTGLFSFVLASHGVSARYNDLLLSSARFFTALMTADPINSELLDQFILSPVSESTILNDLSPYFTYEDLQRLESYLQFISNLEDNLTKDILRYVLAQSSLQKQSGGHFQEGISDTRRNRDNNSTWNTPFSEMIPPIFQEVNTFLANRSITGQISASNKSWSELPHSEYEVDLIFADPPYTPRNAGGRQLGNYIQSYHLIDLILEYPDISMVYRKQDGKLVKYKENYPHLVQNKQWLQPEFIKKSFEQLFNRCMDSQLILTYREGGYMGIKEIKELMSRFYREVEIVKLVNNPRSSIHEYLFIGSTP